MGEHKIEFDAGEVIRPEFSPENDLVAIYVSDEGLESLREAICPDQSLGSSGDESLAAPEIGGELLDDGLVDLGMVRVRYEVRVPEEL